MNVQCEYHILAYKDWLMLWQTSIMSFGKQGFFDWIIPTIIHPENQANTETTSARIG